MALYITWWADALCDVINHFADESVLLLPCLVEMTALSQAGEMLCSLWHSQTLLCC